MKLKIEIWVEKAEFSTNAVHLFQSAATCYKNEVYTAALLMSYIGFLVVLKERVMKASKPGIFPQQNWDRMINNLKNEDKWEEEIFNAVLQQEKVNNSKERVQDPVFVINDNIRTQIRYWKDRRNDCAHNKDNAISDSHVEAFWSFLQSNLQKITVEGGKANLLNKFQRHFDLSYTPANEDVMPLIREIKSAVDKKELDEFWVGIFPIVNNLFDYRNEANFIDKVFSLNDPVIADSLVNFLKANDRLLMGYLSENPSRLNFFGYSKQEIRNFWNVKIGKLNDPIRFYAWMLRNNLIPDDEIAEANAHLVNTYKYTDNIEDHYTLMNNGFGEVIYQLLFVTNSPSNYLYWKFMSRHYDLYTQYIKFYPLKEEVVRIIVSEMDKDEWRSHFLQNSLNYLFTGYPAKKLEFQNKVTELGLNWPSHLD